MTRLDPMRNGDTSATNDLFGDDVGLAENLPRQEWLAPGTLLLRAWARPQADALLADLQLVLDRAPMRHMTTPGGLRMSVAMSNCGEWGWISDRTGYRYEATDPCSDLPWPAMPTSFSRLATAAAKLAGFDGFEPDACLVNRYEPGARLTLHQDRNERSFDQPIVSVSLGLPAVFLFGGATRAATTARIPLTHGDVVVWGGPARLRYHGVLALKDGYHAMTGRYRINLTFRRAT